MSSMASSSCMGVSFENLLRLVTLGSSVGRFSGRSEAGIHWSFLWRFFHFSLKRLSWVPSLDSTWSTAASKVRALSSALMRAPGVLMPTST